jgi:hypothetical protein
MMAAMTDDDDEYLSEEDILVGGEDEEVEELDNKPPACKSKPVQKSVPEKFVAAQKKNYGNNVTMMKRGITLLVKAAVKPQRQQCQKRLWNFSAFLLLSVYTLVYELFL